MTIQLNVNNNSSSLTAPQVINNERLKEGTLQVVARNWYDSIPVALGKSKLFKAVLVGTLGVVALFTLGLYSTAWMIAAVVVTAIAEGSFSPFSRLKQRLEFGFSAISRLFKKRNYDEICFSRSDVEKSRLFLGAMPNKLDPLWKESFMDKEKIGAVLSVNEPWERTPQGLSIPFAKEDWDLLGINYKEIDFKDHTLLDDRSLNEAADFINANMANGKNVYIHCRAGCGRSAMAIAAYLIKYQKKTAEEACEIIRISRPVSTIKKKIERLKEYEQGLSSSFYQKMLALFWS